MEKFEKLFGISSQQVKENCIILPIVGKGMLAEFGVKSLKRGKLYGSANTEDFTLINSGMGAGFVGDVVLYLKETACENIFLFGSCGSTGKLDIGSLVAPVKCYSKESFTHMLSKSGKWEEASPDKKLLSDFLKADEKSAITKTTCVTVASLKLEEDMLPDFQKRAVGVVDMECSAFFSAASFIKRRALSLFYVLDVIEKKPCYDSLSVSDDAILKFSIKNAVWMLNNFIKQKSGE